MSPGGRGGAYTAGEEEMEDHVEMEEDSTGTVPMIPVDGTFIEDTAGARLLNLGIPPNATTLFDLRKQ